MGEDDLSGFGPLLRQLRTASGLTQEALADAAGLSARGIQELERGDHHPYRETLRRLVRALALDGENARRLALAGRPRCRRQAGREAAAERRDGLSSDGHTAWLKPPGSALEALPHSRHNLPAEMSSFVGREREVARVKELLTHTRLLTLTGPGGCGKTRLARRAAEDLAGLYPDGTWLVELAPLADPSLVCQRVASALSVGKKPGQPLLDTLRSELRNRRLVLLLDNCEHVVDECAVVAECLLTSCPGIQMIATSRESLRVSGEVTLTVPPLAIPDADQTVEPEQLAAYDAVALLVERARDVCRAFRVTAENAGAVADVVTRLDGMPLALELAAARLDSLSIHQLAARLDQSFGLLVCGPRTAPPRQRTLKGALDWSYQLLTESERTLFRRLALFETRFSLEAAEGICSGDVRSDDVLDLLSCLVRKSLVLAEVQSGETQYRMLRTVRQYAEISLAEHDGPTPACGRFASRGVEVAV